MIGDADATKDHTNCYTCKKCLADLSCSRFRFNFNIQQLLPLSDLWTFIFIFIPIPKLISPLSLSRPTPLLVFYVLLLSHESIISEREAPRQSATATWHIGGNRFPRPGPPPSSRLSPSPLLLRWPRWRRRRRRGKLRRWQLRRSEHPPRTVTPLSPLPMAIP